ncbi:MAG: ATP-binding protein, partial [Candidatus Izemoplasma sp.]
ILGNNNISISSLSQKECSCGDKGSASLLILTHEANEGDLKQADINEGIESTLILIKNKLDGIKIKKTLEKLPPTECNPGKINQMIMNLIDNAIYAIHKKDMNNSDGVIDIFTTTDNGFVSITIKDNGIGIPEKIKNKLFEPFFTTKDVGDGTGLGLSIVRSIIDSHNGEIKINSEINEGTELIIKIPITKKINGEN